MIDMIQRAWQFWSWEALLYWIGFIVIFPQLALWIWYKWLRPTSTKIYHLPISKSNFKNDYIFQVFKLMDDVTNDNTIYDKEKLRILKKLADLQNELQPYST